MIYYRKLKGSNRKCPLIQVEIYNPLNQRVIRKFKGLLDTGSDITLMPKTRLNQIQAKLIGEEESFGCAGNTFDAPPYVIGLQLHTYSTRGHLVYAWNEEFALIGRDLLNKFRIRFNGIDGFFDFY